MTALCAVSVWKKKKVHRNNRERVINFVIYGHRSPMGITTLRLNSVALSIFYLFIFFSAENAKKAEHRAKLLVFHNSTHFFLRIYFLSSKKWWANIIYHCNFLFVYRRLWMFMWQNSVTFSIAIFGCFHLRFQRFFLPQLKMIIAHSKRYEIGGYSHTALHHHHHALKIRNKQKCIFIYALIMLLLFI